MDCDHPKWEVHIVGYGDSDLTHPPALFFTNRVDVATQGFCSIATLETNSLRAAYSGFEKAYAWCLREVKRQKSFGVHVKLEECRESLYLPELVYSGRLRRVRIPKKFQSTVVSAWDVHLDGQFDDQLRNDLFEQGYIRLDYLDTKGVSCTTMTLHFLRQEACVREFEWIAAEVKRTGGFKGTVYWEDPLAFVVVGETLPRPVAL